MNRELEVELVQAILDLNGKGETTFGKIRIQSIPNYMFEMAMIRFIVEPDDPDLNIQTAYNVAIGVFSEASGDDACEVFVREVSGHLDSHKEFDGLHGDEMKTVIEVWITDSLS